jgi:hypothetical protein
MTDARNYAPLSQLVSELKILCREGRTGTAYVVTDDNRMARLGLAAGKIDFIWFHSRRGADALILMSHIHAGRLRFEDGVKAAADAADLPTTAEILEFLLAPQSGVGSPSPAQQSRSGTPPPASDTQQQGPPAVGAAERTMIEEILTDYVGPMASIICDEQLNECSDLESALNSLAAEIQDSGQIKEFLDRVHARLGTARRTEEPAGKGEQIAASSPWS